MVSTAVKLAGITLLSAYLWQIFFHDFLFYGLGVGRTHNHIEDYPYTCRQLRHPLLESCEDLVLDPEERVLYAACSSALGRKEWSPGGK